MKVKRDRLLEWYHGMEGDGSPKFITGIRGVGKSQLLMRLRDHLRANGAPDERLLVLDSFSPELRRISSFEQILRHVRGMMPDADGVRIFIREASALPDPEVLLTAMCNSLHLEILATTSSCRLMRSGITGDTLSRNEPYLVLPDGKRRKYSAGDARSRFNDIFLNDVICPNHVLEVPLICRVTAWLSDHVGDELSLRLVANAVSPAHRLLSPHTVGSYLVALEDANLIARASKWDLSQDVPVNVGYRYFFTDPDLRVAHYGAAPEREGERMALNRAWLRLRQVCSEVYVSSDDPEIDFVTRENGMATYWHLEREGDDGSLIRLDR